MLDLKIVCDDEKYLPEYANDTDACMDLKVVVPNQSGFVLSPKHTKVFRTGIKVAIPKDHVMMVFPRSSTGVNLKCRLMNSTGIIDSGYRDEIKLAVHNFGDYSVTVEDGQRVAQFMIVPRPQINLSIVPDNDDFRNGDRGGGIGSSGK
jgi:dUTP pyrophosphatase